VWPVKINLAAMVFEARHIEFLLPSAIKTQPIVITPTAGARLGPSVWFDRLPVWGKDTLIRPPYALEWSAYGTV
jgi:hypothetical protein